MGFFVRLRGSVENEDLVFNKLQSLDVETLTKILEQMKKPLVK